MMNGTKLYEIKTKHFIKDTKKVKFPGSVMIDDRHHDGLHKVWVSCIL